MHPNNRVTLEMAELLVAAGQTPSTSTDGRDFAYGLRHGDFWFLADRVADAAVRLQNERTRLESGWLNRWMVRLRGLKLRLTPATIRDGARAFPESESAI